MCRTVSSVSEAEFVTDSSTTSAEKEKWNTSRENTQERPRRVFLMAQEEWFTKRTIT